MWTRYLIAAVALASLAVSGVAKASTETISLTGKVADSAYGTIISGGVTYSTWILPLDGLSPTNGFGIVQGDHINGTVFLDQNFTVEIPAAI